MPPHLVAAQESPVFGGVHRAKSWDNDAGSIQISAGRALARSCGVLKLGASDTCKQREHYRR